ncbi:NAD-dependent epimerase/dehydratase family protein [Bacteroidota bacterium]
MTKILITGANSFVGTNFKIYSRYRDVEEISLLNNEPEDIDFSKYNVVIHLAAIVHQSKKITKSEYFQINKDLCLRVADNAKKAGISQFIFLSTVKVYGKFIPESGLLNEDSKCVPGDFYAQSKYEAEIGLIKRGDMNFTVSIIRTPLVYGERVKANMLRMVKLVDTNPLLPFGRMENKRDFTYIENLVSFIDQIISKNASGIFIVKDEKAISTTDLVNYLSKHLGRKVTLFKLPKLFRKFCTFFAPDVMDRLYGSLEFDNEKTKMKINYKPPFSTEEGVRKMVLYYKGRKRN